MVTIHEKLLMITNQENTNWKQNEGQAGWYLTPNQAWWPEFDSQDPHGKRRKQIPTSCRLAPVYTLWNKHTLHKYTNINKCKINNNT